MGKLALRSSCACTINRGPSVGDSVSEFGACQRMASHGGNAMKSKSAYVHCNLIFVGANRSWGRRLSRFVPESRQRVRPPVSRAVESANLQA